MHTLKCSHTHTQACPPPTYTLSICTQIKQYLENGTFAELGSLEGVAVEKATAAPQVAHAFL